MRGAKRSSGQRPHALFAQLRSVDERLKHRHQYYEEAHVGRGRHLYTARCALELCGEEARGIERTHPIEFLGGTRIRGYIRIYCVAPYFAHAQLSSPRTPSCSLVSMSGEGVDATYPSG